MTTRICGSVGPANAARVHDRSCGAPKLAPALGSTDRKRSTKGGSGAQGAMLEAWRERSEGAGWRDRRQSCRAIHYGSTPVCLPVGASGRNSRAVRLLSGSPMSDQRTTQRVSSPSGLLVYQQLENARVSGGGGESCAEARAELAFANLGARCATPRALREPSVRRPVRIRGHREINRDRPGSPESGHMGPDPLSDSHSGAEIESGGVSAGAGAITAGSVGIPRRRLAFSSSLGDRPQRSRLGSEQACSMQA